MAILGATLPTLLEVSKNFGEDGQPLPLAELLTERNDLLNFMPWYEANSTHGHRVAIRTGLPNAVFRRLNAGIPPSKSRYANVVESIGLLSSLGTVDQKLADIAPDTAEFRLRENSGHIEAMNQEFARTLIYGDTDLDGEKFLGLSPRYNARAGVENARNVIHGGGAGSDNTSIWLLGLGPDSVFGIYPKGSQAGLQHRDMGIELVDDGAGGKFPAYRDWFEWDCGLVVKDWRYAVRIANIDVSDLDPDPGATGGTGAQLIDLMTQALETIQSLTGVQPVFATNRTVASFARRQSRNEKNVRFDFEEIAGKKVTSFDGVPIVRMDALAENEGVVA